MGLFFVSQI